MGLKCYSHYDKKKNIYKLIPEHSYSVAMEARDTVPPTVHFGIIENIFVKQINYVGGKLHDTGKYTDFSQKYLIEGVRHKRKYHFHGHISALFAYNYVAELLKENKEHKKIAFLSYLAVRLHHSNLSLDGLFKPEIVPYQQEIISEQANNLKPKIKGIAKQLEVPEKIFDVDLSYIEYDGLIGKQPSIIKLEPHERWFFLLVYIFSQLIDKDKLDAARVIHAKPSLPSEQKVPEYLHQKHGKIDKNDNKEVARQTIVNSIKSLTDESIKQTRIFTLTAPTGLGKTLSSLQAALCLSRRLYSLYKYTPKIIMAAPFINIVEQTLEDYENVCGKHSRVRVHHQFSDLENKDTISEEKSLDQVLLEVESWEGDIVITTFVQLFQSLFSGRNKSLKKVNKIAGGIVILDEIQSIPEQYMPIVGALLYKLADYWGTRFIIMTATQPHIANLGLQLLKNNGKESLKSTTYKKPYELLPDYHKNFFSKLNRTMLKPHLEKVLDTNSFIQFFEKTWGQKSSLIVVNRIKRCIEIYEKLKKKFENDSTIAVFHLSTNLVPEDRKKIIKTIKQRLESNKTTILVSTQTIEAGVDLSFDVGYRDLAPLESIIQVAGRVGRYASMDEKKYAPVYIIQIEDDHKIIYPFHHLNKTREMLKSKGEIPEYDYQELVDDYYKEFSNQVSDESLDLWKAIQTLDFKAIQNFQLIKDKGSINDVFVELNDEASKLANEYLEIRKKDVLDYETKAKLKNVLSKMGRYMIQIRDNRLKKKEELVPPNELEMSFYWINRKQVHQFYDSNVGYREIE